MSIGEKLKKARKERGWTLKDVQNKTKIRSRYLQALEEENFDIIPGEAYVRAFIKGYANQLGLDGNKLAEEYQQLKKEETRLEKEESQTIELPDDDNGNFFLHSKVLSASIVIILLLVIGFVVYNVFLLNDSQYGLQELSETYSTQSSNSDFSDKAKSDKIETPQSSVATDSILKEPQKAEDTEEQADNMTNYVDNVIEEKKDNAVKSSIPVFQKSSENKPVREEENKIEVIKENRIVEDEENKEVQNIEKEKSIQIIVTARCWLRVKVDGKKVFEGILEKGDVKEFKGKKELYMKMGNAGGIKVKKGNEIIGPLGKSGEVTSKVFEF